MIALLFASGTGERWKGPMLKQLALVAGEPVIVRTMKQLKARRIRYVVITHEPDIKSAVVAHKARGGTFFSPASTKYPNTFIDSVSLWKGRVLALHADVIWDDKALDIVCSSQGLGFYGTRKGPWENFAIGFDPEHYDRMLDAAWFALDNHPEERCGSWEFYRSVVGIDLRKTHDFEDKVWHEVKESVTSDFTCDFDTVQKYNNFVRANPWAGEILE